MIYFLIVGIALIIGIFGGDFYEAWRLEAATAARYAVLKTELVSSAQGISLNAPFPDFPVWTLDSEHGLLISELFPHGGIIVYTAADCSSCFETLEQLAGATTSHSRNRPLIMVVHGDIESLNKHLTDKEYPFPIYWDTKRTLVDQHMVRIFPAYFKLGPRGELSHLGTDMKELEQLLTKEG
jgi:hypothetical protein